MVLKNHQNKRKALMAACALSLLVSMVYGALTGLIINYELDRYYPVRQQQHYHHHHHHHHHNHHQRPGDTIRVASKDIHVEVPNIVPKDKVNSGVIDDLKVEVSAERNVGGHHAGHHQGHNVGHHEGYPGGHHGSHPGGHNPEHHHEPNLDSTTKKRATLERCIFTILITTLAISMLLHLIGLIGAWREHYGLVAIFTTLHAIMTLVMVVGALYGSLSLLASVLLNLLTIAVAVTYLVELRLLRNARRR